MINERTAFKRELFDFLIELTNNKISEVTSELNAVQSSANSETKSTVGDKYETARAMAMLEKEKLSSQLSVLTRQLQSLNSISFNKEYSEIKNGSLIHTNYGTFVIVTAIGKVSFKKEELFVISPIAPLAQSLIGKKKGETVNFQNREYSILDVY
jgi:transcription elongation GreA/GreB family factor